MTNYELTILLPEKATPAKKKSVSEKIKKIVTGAKGKVAKVDDWGKKDLAYPIGGNTAGNYLIFELELEPGSAKELDSKLNLEEEILRYLLIRKG